MTRLTISLTWDWIERVIARTSIVIWFKMPLSWWMIAINAICCCASKACSAKKKKGSINRVSLKKPGDITINAYSSRFIKIHLTIANSAKICSTSSSWFQCSMIAYWALVILFYWAHCLPLKWNLHWWYFLR